MRQLADMRGKIVGRAATVGGEGGGGNDGNCDEGSDGVAHAASYARSQASATVGGVPTLDWGGFKQRFPSNTNPPCRHPGPCEGSKGKDGRAPPAWVLRTAQDDEEKTAMFSDACPVLIPSNK